MTDELFLGEKNASCVFFFFAANFDFGKKKTRFFWILMNEWPTSVSGIKLRYLLLSKREKLGYIRKVIFNRKKDQRKRS